MENNIYEFFKSINEPYAMGLFENEDLGYFGRHCNAYAAWFDMAEVPAYDDGELLYPCKNKYFEQNHNKRFLKPSFASTYSYDGNGLKKKCEELDSQYAFDKLDKFLSVSRFKAGFIHGSPNYSRIVKEGLDSYRDRILQKSPATEEEKEFCDGLVKLLDSMKRFANRCVDYLISVNAPKKLIEALKQVPFKPARNYYEGLVCRNVIFYFDGCDNLGCLDSGLAHLYNGEDLTDVIGELFDNVDAVGMWSCTIGHEYNDITRQALKAIKNRRRPMLELMVKEDMPQDIWQIASESICTGSTNPSFYNDKGIHDMLHNRFSQISEDDLSRFCGCGCTETNLEGLTRAGGTDYDINLLKAFEEYMHDDLADKKTFEEFFEGFCNRAEEYVAEYIDATEEIYKYHSEYLPHPMRTLLFDDCIDKCKDFNAGGARYTWTMNSESGMINVIDSLSAIKRLCYDDKKYSADEFLSLLKSEDEDFYKELGKCPSFGVDNDEVDMMGAEFAKRVYNVFRNKVPSLDFIDGFTLTEHQFLRYENCGKIVGATPDGRHAGEPTCDSLAALRGKAVKGPTAMLRSSAKLPQHLVDGISVVNLTLTKVVCNNPELLKAIILGYFSLGGIQIQVTATSVEELQDALENPEKHKDLIVRVGGYSEYFNNLTPALKQAIIERNIHEI